MKVNLINNGNDIRAIPFNEEEPFIEITEEELELIHKGELKVNNGILIDNKNEVLKIKLRKLREPLLLAFDKYKLNVFYGIEFEDEKQVNEILNWYKQIKELNEDYITDEELIPKRIKYYL